MIPRGQAALFDGIMFLLIASMSAGIMYVAMMGYGDSQDRVMRSSHVLNYMQSTMKGIYSIHSSTLENVRPISVGADEAADCSKLGRWKGTITVADLLKKDLSDPPGVEDDAIYVAGRLDDRYGTADAAGKTALWCLLSEVMKPFTSAGYNYLGEVLNAKFGQTYPSDAQYVVTNSPEVQSNPQAFPRGQPLCDAVSNLHQETLTVASPFRIIIEDNGVPQTVQYTLRVCVWPSSEATAG